MKNIKIKILFFLMIMHLFNNDKALAQNNDTIIKNEHKPSYLLTLSLFASPQIQYGSSKDLPTYNIPLGLMLSIDFGNQKRGGIGISTGLIFDLKKYKLITATSSSHTEVEFNSLDIPLLVNINIKNTYINIGGIIPFFIANKKDRDAISSELGFRIGLGHKFPINKKGLILQIEPYLIFINNYYSEGGLGSPISITSTQPIAMIGINLKFARVFKFLVN